MTRKFLIVSSLIVCSACISDSPLEEESLIDVQLAVGGQGLLVYLPTTLALQLGHYRAEGLDVTIQDFSGGAKALQALVGGSADVVSGYYDHTIQMAAEGRPLKAFVMMLRYPGLVAAVSPSTKKHITSIKDFDGTIVGVTAPGSSTHFFVNHLLATHGLAPDTISVTGIGGTATAVAAMERGVIDVGILLEPAVTELKTRNPDLKIIADTRTSLGVLQVFGSEIYPAAVMYSSENWIDENHDTVGRLVRATTRTLEWIQTHSAKEIMAAMPTSMLGDNPDRYLIALEHTIPMYSPDGRMSAEGARSVKQVLSLSLPKVKDTNVTLENTYTNEFIDDQNR